MFSQTVALCLVFSTLRIAINGRPVTVSTNRVKPAYIMAEPDSSIVTARASPEQSAQSEDLQFQMKMNAELQHEKKILQEKLYNLEFS